MTQEEKNRLEEYEADMLDDFKSWKQAEIEIKDAEEWLKKMALRYAESAVKYYNYLNEIKK
jgi:hypothetical protein